MALRIALDTNAYSSAAKNDPRLRQVVSAAEQIFLPFVVVGELRAGFTAGSLGRRNEAGLVTFLSSPRVEVLYADEQTTHHYASIYAQLRRAGTPIPTNDLWIAALAVQNDLALCSTDCHFAHIPQLLGKDASPNRKHQGTGRDERPIGPDARSGGADDHQGQSGKTEYGHELCSTTGASALVTDVLVVQGKPRRCDARHPG